MPAEKTEHPTPRRLREARRRGQVAKSAELATASLLIGIAVFLSVFATRIDESLRTAFRQYIAHAFAAPALTVDSASALLEDAIRILLGASVPLVAAGAVVVGVVVFLQVGPHFSIHPISPDTSRLNPFTSVMSRFFSGRTMLDFLKAVLKVAIVSLALYLMAAESLRDIGLTIRQPIEATAVLTQRLLFRITLGIGGMLLVLGVLDLLLQRRQLVQNLRMTKEEVAREQRQQEGDPQHRSERKRLHREILSTYRGVGTPGAEERSPVPTTERAPAAVSRSSASAGGNPGAQ